MDSVPEETRAEEQRLKVVADVLFDFYPSLLKSPTAVRGTGSFTAAVSAARTALAEDQSLDALPSGVEWPRLKAVLAALLQEACLQMRAEGEATPTEDGRRLPRGFDFEGRLSDVLDYLDSFERGPPMTLQRLTELVLEPRRWYSDEARYLTALEKTLMVAED